MFLKFDVFNVLELFDSLKRTIVFVYGLFGLDKYIMWRVYGIYHQEDEKLFRTTENAAKLIIRCKLGYEMIEKWTKLFELICKLNDLIFIDKRSLISKSVWNIISEVTNKNVKAKQNEEERILKGIEDLIDFNNKISAEINTLSNSEFKMLFSVATYRIEEKDSEGKLHILGRK